jgi:hypothetical protein
MDSRVLQMLSSRASGMPVGSGMMTPLVVPRKKRVKKRVKGKKG